MIEIDNSDGLDETMRGLVFAALDPNPNINAVYSIGGGNMAIVEAFASMRRTSRSSSRTTSTRTIPGYCAAGGYQRYPPRPQPGHAARLLRHHAGAQSAARSNYSWPSNIHIITPYNMPSPALSHP